jgi:quercetin dioxygenase-like cupin family protein
VNPPAGAADLASTFTYFFDDAAFVETDRPGFRRRVIVGEHMELWFWRISGGADGSVLHNHDANEQLGIIMRGALDFRIGDADDTTRKVLRAGDVYLAPKTVWHGDSVFIGDDEFGEVWILDVFAPPRSGSASNGTAP